jgi:cytochrome P450
MPAAVEEFLRIAGPARSMPRKVAVAHERGGQRLEPGQNVFLGIVSANHDPSVFPNPATIDLTRDPNPHMGFGWGLHFCLGANLARLEARVALNTLFQRFERFEPAAPIPPNKATPMGFGRRPVLTRLR